MISSEGFGNAELRGGTIIRAEEFPAARKPAYRPWIDFGELGVKKSSAESTALYRREDLVGRQVVCVVNFPPKQVADFISECLTTGFVAEKGDTRSRNGK